MAVTIAETKPKTIKEIADELGVDKQRVYRFIKKNHINEVHHEALQKSGVKRYDEAAETLIRQGFFGESASSEAHHEVLQNCFNEAVFEALSDMLRKELEAKNEQLAVKDKQIAELNARLAETTAALVAAQQTAQAAQALHAGTIQQQLTAGSVETAEAPTEKKKKRWWQRD